MSSLVLINIIRTRRAFDITYYTYIHFYRTNLFLINKCTVNINLDHQLLYILIFICIITKENPRLCSKGLSLLCIRLNRFSLSTHVAATTECEALNNLLVCTTHSNFSIDQEHIVVDNVRSIVASVTCQSICVQCL